MVVRITPLVLLRLELIVQWTLSRLIPAVTFADGFVCTILTTIIGTLVIVVTETDLVTRESLGLDAVANV